MAPSRYAHVDAFAITWTRERRTAVRFGGVRVGAVALRVCVYMRGRMCALACDNGRARGYRRSEADVQVHLSASARQALRCFSSREHTQVN